MVGTSLEINKEKCNDRETATTWSGCQPLTGRQTWNENCTEWTSVGGPAGRNYASGWKTATQSDPSWEWARDTRTLPSRFPSLASVLLVGSNRNPEQKKARLFRTHWSPPGLAIRGRMRAHKMHRTSPDSAEWSLPSGSSPSSCGISGVSKVIKRCRHHWVEIFFYHNEDRWKRNNFLTTSSSVVCNMPFKTSDYLNHLTIAFIEIAQFEIFFIFLRYGKSTEIINVLVVGSVIMTFRPRQIRRL